MNSGFQSLSSRDAQEVSRMFATPLDVGVGWNYLDDLDYAMWIRDSVTSAMSSSSAVSNTSTPPPTAHQAAPRRPRPRAPRLSDPEECARRRAHRRSLQKGYEKDYRLRKRQTRESLRTEWLQLEYKLKADLLAAQSRAVQRVDPTATMERKLDEELEAECVGLQTEHTLLTYKLATETRLREAREYFTQPKMREKLNALATTPCVMKLEFMW